MSFFIYILAIQSSYHLDSNTIHQPNPHHIHHWWLNRLQTDVCPKTEGGVRQGGGHRQYATVLQRISVSKAKKDGKKNTKEHMTYWYPIGIKWHKTWQNMVRRGKTPCHDVLSLLPAPCFPAWTAGVAAAPATRRAPPASRPPPGQLPPAKAVVIGASC